MGRRYRPQVDYSHNRQTNTPQIQSFWKSPATLVTGFIGIILLTLPLLFDSTIQRVISIQASDVSLSAQEFPFLKQQHCEAQARHLKQDDTLVEIQFADKPEVIRDTTINNTLFLSGQCQQSKFDSKKPKSGIGKYPGTSIVSLLERIQIIIVEKRAKGFKNPIVVTITLHEAEPGVGQPKLDFERIQTLVQKITSDRALVTIMGTNGDLQSKLSSSLQNNNNAKICAINDIADCVEWSFETGRGMSNR